MNQIYDGCAISVIKILRNVSKGPFFKPRFMAFQEPEEGIMGFLKELFIVKSKTMICTEKSSGIGS